MPPDRSGTAAEGGGGQGFCVVQCAHDGAPQTLGQPVLAAPPEPYSGAECGLRIYEDRLPKSTEYYWIC